MSNNAYIEMRQGATKVINVGGYDIHKAESNPLLFEMLVGEMLVKNLPLVVWEPFAGHSGSNANQNFAESLGCQLISFDLEPSDDRVVKADSTVTEPGCELGGVFFHPPYFGSALLSDDSRDISKIKVWEDYLENLCKTVLIIDSWTVSRGLVFAIGRDYQHLGRRIRLDQEYLRLFEQHHFKIVNVLKSEPDVVLVFEKL